MTARPMSTMTTRPPLSIKLREWSKLWKSMPSTLATWSKKELLETLEGGEGGGEVAVECWCWRADMIGPTERGRNPGDPEHMGSSKNWNGKYIFQLICGIERFSSHKELHTFCWKSGEKRHFKICFMINAYARPDKHQSYQKIIDKDITFEKILITRS